MGFLDIFRKSKNKIAYGLVSDAKNNMEKQLGTKTETMPDVRVERVRNDRRGRYNPDKDRLGITQDIFEEYLRKSKLVEYYKKNKPYDFEKNVFKLKPSYEINVWVNPKSEDAYNIAYKKAHVDEKNYLLIWKKIFIMNSFTEIEKFQILKTIRGVKIRK